MILDIDKPSGAGAAAEIVGVERVDHGFSLLDSDNAAMFAIDLADEYVNVRDAFGCPLHELEYFSLAAIDACWADDTTKLAMRRDFLAEMDDLRSAHGLPAR